MSAATCDPEKFDGKGSIARSVRNVSE